MTNASSPEPASAEAIPEDGRELRLIVARGPFIPNKGLIRESFAKTIDVRPEEWREPVDIEKAREAQRRLTNVAFGNLDRETGEPIRPHFEIPVNRNDDDVILLRALDELEAQRRERATDRGKMTRLARELIGALGEVRISGTIAQCERLGAAEAALLACLGDEP